MQRGDVEEATRLVNDLDPEVSFLSLVWQKFFLCPFFESLVVIEGEEEEGNKRL